MSTSFQRDAEITPVLFRKWFKREGGGVIALFPTQLGTTDVSGSCSSFEHVGQHGAANQHHVINNSKRATPHEYAELKAELEGVPYGYRMRVYARMQHDKWRRMRQHNQSTRI